MSATPEDVDAERDATSARGIFMEAADRLRICTDDESENRLRGLNALNFVDGEQWDEDIKNDRKIDRRPALTINLTSTFCARLKNTLRQQRPRIKCHPVGGGARIEDAEVVNGLIRHIETLSNASVAYDTGVESAVDIGWGYWRIVSEYIDPKSFDQELMIKPIRNRFVVYMDPSSVMPAGEDQQWCLITETMKRREYKRKYPNAINAEWKADGAGDMTLDWENKEEVRLAEYYRIHEVGDVLYMMSDGRTAYKSELPDREILLAAGLRIAVNHAGKPIQRPTTRREVQWFRLNGRNVIDERSSDKAKRTGNAADGPIHGRFIPVIRCEGNVLDINGCVKRKGMVQDLMDPARMFNYWRGQALDTPIATPVGWSTMGALRAGDEVFDEHGRPTKIIGKSTVKIRERCFRITFGDGSKVIADWDHPWPVEERGKRITAGWTWSNRKIATEDLVPKKHFIAVAKPLECEEALLPVHPYLLGLWLGDGNTTSPQICPGDEDLDEVRAGLVSLGYELGVNKRSSGGHASFTVLGQAANFRQIGVLGQKHVPKSYLRASVDQRWALLRGFMDSDGSIGKRNKQCSYTTTNVFIAEGFKELVRSLGIRLSVCKREGRRSQLVGADSVVRPFWQFSFSCYADEPAFGLKRKQALLPRATEHRRRTKRHSIVSVEEIPSVPTQCIGIDTPTHLFLCGESMIPTHNTAQTERYALTPKAPWVAAEGQLEGHPEWQDANRKSYSTLIYKPIAGPDGQTMIPPPQRQMPAQVEAGMTEAAQGAQTDLMSVGGMPMENPEITARVVSGNKHLQRRQGMQDLTHFQYYDKQTLAIMWTGIILLEQIPYVYDTRRMQRIIGEDGIPQVVEINAPPTPGGDEPGTAPAVYRVKNNLEMGRYDVVMDTGPGYATKREEGTEAVLELLGTPLGEPIVQTGADIVVRNMDFAGAEELADRLVVTNDQGLEKVVKGLPKQAQTIIGAMQKQMQGLQQTVQQQALELKYHGTVKAAEMETKLKVADQQDKTKRYDIDVDSTTRRDVAEIGAAAQLLNSKLESSEEEKQADKLIAKGVD